MFDFTLTLTPFVMAWALHWAQKSPETKPPLLILNTFRENPKHSNDLEFFPGSILSLPICILIPFQDPNKVD